MGDFANGPLLKVFALASAALVIVLNAALIFMQTGEWAEAAEGAGWGGGWVYAVVLPLTAVLACFLLWVAVYPYRQRREVPSPLPAAPELPAVSYRRIGVAVEFTAGDDAVLAQAAALARVHSAPVLLIHVVEGTAAAVLGPEADDQESRGDRARMAELVRHLRQAGINADGVLGYGEPPGELVRIAQEQHLDILVLGTHGHRFFADLALGQTVAPVLHRLAIPILVVPTAARSSADSSTSILRVKSLQ
jgi:manganese transport protein